MDPNGKVAVITGGASGIGLCTARLLAEKGARIVIADLQDDAGAKVTEEIEAGGRQARFVHTDVTSSDDLQGMLDFAVAQFGRVDIIYNNAGVGEGGENLFDLGSSYWVKTIAIDLEAVIRGTQLAVQLFRKQGGGGVIINTASMAGLVPVGTTPVYAAVKAGVIHFSRSLAHLGSEEIRVNAICPQYTDTPMVRAGGEAAMEFMRREVGGILEPEQIAEGVLQLIEDETAAGAIMRVTFRRGIEYWFERGRK